MNKRSLQERFHKRPNYEIRLLYDQWICPNSTQRKQICVGPMTTDELLKEYGDFLYNGAYTTGLAEDGHFTMDVWATATDERLYIYPKVINPKQQVTTLLKQAMDGEDHLELLKENGKIVGYWDNKNDYKRIYHYNDTVETVESRILLDEQVSKFVDKKALAVFLLDHLDPNVLMCMEYIAFVYETENEESTARNYLQEGYGDEYAWYIAETGDGLLGQTWVERQVPVINVSNLLESSAEIASHPDEHLSVQEIFAEGLLQTIFHECRHLFYECNELVPIGEGSPYPQNGGWEDEVEDYGNAEACKYLSDFEANLLDNKVLAKEMPKMIKECTQEQKQENNEWENMRD